MEVQLRAAGLTEGLEVPLTLTTLPSCLLLDGTISTIWCRCQFRLLDTSSGSKVVPTQRL